MSKKLTIYYCGNELLQEDDMPFRIVPELMKLFPEFGFVHHDPAENLAPIPSSAMRRGKFDIVIIDTVINSDKVITITSQEQLSTEAVYSPHDWGLAMNLKLLIKLGELKSFLIIGVPAAGNLKKIIDEAARIIGQI